MKKKQIYKLTARHEVPHCELVDLLFLKEIVKMYESLWIRAGHRLKKLIELIAINRNLITCKYLTREAIVLQLKHILVYQ